MLRLRQLKFSGIGRFVEEQVIDFDALGNMVQVDGQNNNKSIGRFNLSTLQSRIEQIQNDKIIEEEAVQSKIEGEGYSAKVAGAILASKTRNASASAKKKNPRLLRVEKSK